MKVLCIILLLVHACWSIYETLVGAHHHSTRSIARHRIPVKPSARRPVLVLVSVLDNKVGNR
jgi:hypothetical protein